MKYIGKDSKETIVSRFAEYVSPGKAETFKAYDMEFVFGRREGRMCGTRSAANG